MVFPQSMAVITPSELSCHHCNIDLWPQNDTADQIKSNI